jgi:hypothetical protein
MALRAAGSVKLRQISVKSPWRPLPVANRPALASSYETPQLGSFEYTLGERRMRWRRARKVDG